MDEETARLVQKMDFNPPPRPGLLEEVESRLGIHFPADYVRFISEHDGVAGAIGEHGFLALFRLEEIITLNEIAQIRTWAPGLLMFASNGSGTSYAFDTRSTPMSYVELDDYDISLDKAQPCGTTFAEFLNYHYSLEY